MEGGKYKYAPNGLRKYRLAQGFSQAEVSRLLGFTNTSNLSRWEEGMKFPSLINTIKLAAIYKVYVDALYQDLIEVIRKEMTQTVAQVEEERVPVSEPLSTPKLSP